MTEKIVKISFKEWSRFQNCLQEGPCKNFAFWQGDCYGLLLGDSIDTIASMVWYTWPWKNSPYRNFAIPRLQKMTKAEILVFVNTRITLLARIGTLPEHRKKGYASKLLIESIKLVKQEYIECLTTWDDVKKLLKKTGFIQYQDPEKRKIEYWLLKK